MKHCETWCCYELFHFPVCFPAVSDSLSFILLVVPSLTPLYPFLCLLSSCHHHTTLPQTSLLSWTHFVPVSHTFCHLDVHHFSPSHTCIKTRLLHADWGERPRQKAQNYKSKYLFVQMRCPRRTEAPGYGLTPLFMLLSHSVSLSLCLCVVLHLSSLCPLQLFLPLAFLLCQTLALLVHFAGLMAVLHHPSCLGFPPLLCAGFSHLPHVCASCLPCMSWLCLPLSHGLPHSHALLLSALMSLWWFWHLASTLLAVWCFCMSFPPHALPHSHFMAPWLTIIPFLLLPCSLFPSPNHACSYSHVFFLLCALHVFSHTLLPFSHIPFSLSLTCFPHLYALLLAGTLFSSSVYSHLAVPPCMLPPLMHATHCSCTFSPLQACKCSPSLIQMCLGFLLLSCACSVSCVFVLCICMSHGFPFRIFLSLL